MPPPLNGLAVAALAIGVAAAAGALTPFTAVFSLPLAVTAIVLGILGLSRSSHLEGAGRGHAIGGLVTGVIGMIGVVVWAVVIVGFPARGGVEVLREARIGGDGRPRRVDPPSLADPPRLPQPEARPQARSVISGRGHAEIRIDGDARSMTLEACTIVHQSADGRPTGTMVATGRGPEGHFLVQATPPSTVVVVAGPGEEGELFRTSGRTRWGSDAPQRYVEVEGTFTRLSDSAEVELEAVIRCS